MNAGVEGLRPPEPRAGVGGIDGGAGTVVTDPQAEMHTGSGDQINLTLTDSADSRLLVEKYLSRRTRRRRGAVRVPAEQVQRIDHCFVAPPGFHPARLALVNTRTVFLSGAPGTGRTGAAIALLRSVAPREQPIRRLPDEDEQGRPCFDEHSIREGEPLLLDTTGGDGDLALVTRRELESYRAAVAGSGAHLVVVLSPGQERRYLPEGTSPPVSLGRPEPAEVLRRHLVFFGLPVPDEHLGTEEMRRWLHRADVGDAAELADLLRRARDERGGGGSFGEWLSQARSAQSDWESEVAAQLQKCGTTRQRAVLLAAAMLDGSSADHVLGAAAELHRLLAAPEDGIPPLERPGLTRELDGLGARVGPQRRVAFPSLAYDAAVRDRFWDDFPNLRGRFEEWTSGLLTGFPLAEEERVRLTARLAEQCLRTRRVTELLDLFEDWTSAEGRPGGGADPAGQVGYALQLLLDDRDAAWETRRRIYQWVRPPAPSVPLARALTAVCAQVLVRTHPDQAIIRLRHLARHPDGRIAEEAARRLIGLTEDRGIWKLLVDRLAVRMARARSENRRVAPADLDLLWRATAPERLMPHWRENGPGLSVRESLAQALIAALAEDPREAHRHGRRWLAADERQPAREAMSDLLVETAGAAGRCAALYAAARRWVAEAEEGQERAARRRPARALITRLEERQDPGVRVRGSQTRTGEVAG